MSELVRAQELFWRAIVHPTSVRDFLVQADEETRALFAATFASSQTFSAEERVEVYARGYFFRLLDALATQFPVVKAYLGSDDFHDLVTDFLLAHPSRSPNLHDLGNPLPEFLEAHPLAAARPFLADFARIERALAHSVDAADGNVIAPANLAGIGLEAWPVLRLTPSAALVDSAWDMRRAQRDVREGGVLTEPERSSATLVWRRGHFPVFRPIQPLERAAFGSLERGCSFAELCSIAESEGLDADTMSRTLHGWLVDDLLEAVP